MALSTRHRILADNREFQLHYGRARIAPDRVLAVTLSAKGCLIPNGFMAVLIPDLQIGLTTASPSALG